MAIKGTAIIHLTDVATGQTQEIVHDNMVTNAVSDMCIQAGFLKAPITCTALSSEGTIAEKLFGGLMLWENPLDLTSADDYYMPAANKCIGYGCKLSNGTVNDKMGSFNEAESGKIDNGYRFVWDFATSQGNGQISAVSLVPRIAGQLGVGLMPEKANSELYVPDSSFISGRSEYDELLYCRPYLFANENFLYGVAAYNLGYSATYANEHVSRNGKKLILKRVHLPVTKVHLHDRQLSFNTADSDIEIQLPDSLIISDTATKYYGFCNYDNGFIYLCIGTSNSGGTINTQICKINVQNWSCSVIDISGSFKATTTWCEPFANSGNNKDGVLLAQKARVINNRLLIAAAPGYCVDLNKPTVVQPITYSDGTEINIDALYAPAGKYIYLSSGNSVCMLDTERITASRLNASYAYLKGITSGGDQYNNGKVYHVPHISKKFVFAILYYSSYYYCCIACVAIPHVLTTKNNLETPVTKTADKTMKITYILREE